MADEQSRRTGLSGLYIEFLEPMTRALVRGILEEVAELKTRLEGQNVATKQDLHDLRTELISLINANDKGQAQNMATLDQLTAFISSFEATLQKNQADSATKTAKQKADLDAAESTISVDEATIASDNATIAALQGHVVPDDLIARLGAAIIAMGGDLPAGPAALQVDGSAVQLTPVVLSGQPTTGDGVSVSLTTPPEGTTPGGAAAGQNAGTETAPAQPVTTTEVTSKNLETSSPGDTSNISNLSSTPVAAATTETSNPSTADVSAEAIPTTTEAAVAEAAAKNEVKP